MKRSILIPLVAITFSLTAQAQSNDDTNTNATTSQNANATQTSDITGSYSCQGTTGDGKQYTGTKLTIKQSDQTYQLTWENKEFGKFSGTGLTMQDSANTITAYFANNDKSKRNNNGMGIVIYKASSNGLDGTFAFSGKDKTGTETCTKDQGNGQSDQTNTNQ
jgi:hypothetical protein